MKNEEPSCSRLFHVLAIGSLMAFAVGAIPGQAALVDFSWMLGSTPSVDHEETAGQAVISGRDATAIRASSAPPVTEELLSMSIDFAGSLGQLGNASADEPETAASFRTDSLSEQVTLNGCAFPR